MKKVIVSVFTIFVVVAAVAGATTAFFIDTETSTGNTMTAGMINLGIDNESYYNGVLQNNLTWSVSDLRHHLLFDFDNLLPGDYGEDTISIHVDDEDAWACTGVTLTSNKDNNCADPEWDDDLTCSLGDPNSNGDLAQELNFIWWADNDSDNVFEEDEEVISSGSLGSLGVGNTAVVTLADKDVNIFTGSANTPIIGNDTDYIGTGWCLGTLTENPLPENSDSGPAGRGAGFTCDGASVDNAPQTDSTTLDVSFYAVQSRGNTGFTCGSWTPTD